MLSIFPVINIGAYEMPILYLLVPLQAIMIFFSLFRVTIKPKVVDVILIMLLLITLQIFLTTLISTIVRLDSFVFPSDILQYIAKVFMMIFMILWVYNRKVNGDTFIKLFLFFLSIGMLIGILQWVPWPGREIFVRMYPFKDGLLQLSQLNRTSLTGIRVHGIGQIATANGGLAMFFFLFGFAVFKYHTKYKMNSFILMFLSIVNIFASQSRGGILALLFGIVMINIIDFHIYKKSMRPIFNMLIYFLIFYFTFYLLLANENAVVLKLLSRIDIMFEPNQGGAVRIDQFRYFLSMFNTSADYIMGLSKPIVNLSAFTYGVELEPLNIFVLYGVLGFVLQYGLILFLLTYFFKNLSLFRNDKVILTLLIFSFVGLLSYQVFSLSYYFFREARVGLFPWIVMGVTIGLIEKKKKQKDYNMLNKNEY